MFRIRFADHTPPAARPPSRAPGSRAPSIRTLRIAKLAVLAGVVFYSTNAVFGAWADLSGPGFAFWRCLLAIPILAPLALVTDPGGTFRRRPGTATALSGVLLGVSTVMVMTAAKHAPVALIALVGTLTPLLTGLYEAWRGERMSRSFYACGVAAAGGAAFVAVTDHAASRTDLLGLLLAVGFAVSFASFLISSKAARRDATPIAFLFWSTAWAAVPATVAALATATPLTPLTPRDLAALGLAIACGGTTGHLLVTSSLRLLPATTAAVIRLSQPFFAMLFAWWLVAQQPTMAQLVGGAVTVVAVGVAVVHQPSSRRRRTVEQELEQGL